MLMEEKPSPASLKVQAGLRPSLGQAASKPFSLETPLRSGPRNCGQSSANASEPADRQHRARSRRVFMATSAVNVRSGGRRAEFGGCNPLSFKVYGERSVATTKKADRLLARP